MKEQVPPRWIIILTVFVAIGICCAGLFLTGPSWAHLVPPLPARTARDPTPTAAPTFTAIPTPTNKPIPATPTPTSTPLPLLTFGTARPVPLIPIPTPTPSFTATPIPTPTSTALILFAPTWPVVNPTYTPWIGPTATTQGGSSSSGGSDEEEEEVEDDNDEADDNDDDIASGPCCRVCKIGKACGDTCIAKEKQCTVGDGCACNFSQP